MKSGIYLVATPIGNIGDISVRALEVLRNADIVACEDSRVTRKLFSLLGLSTENKNFIIMHDHNEAEISQKIIDLVLEGHIAAYVSDAGSPLISDPGYKLAKKCREQQVYITTIPGACAAICGLQLSGLPSNSFLFAGFIPNREKARIEMLKKFSMIDTTLIFYETANRLVKTLYAAKQVFGNREIAVAREISKIYEDCRNGKAEELIEFYEKNPPKGEIVLLVEPPALEINIDYESALKQELELCSLKDAVKNIANRFNVNKNQVYQKALELKK